MSKRRSIEQLTAEKCRLDGTITAERNRRHHVEQECERLQRECRRARAEAARAQEEVRRLRAAMGHATAVA